MRIDEATRSYERWLAQQTPVVSADIRLKHEFMTEAPFPFFRATFYRWLQLWPELCAEAAGAPKVLGIGDIHIENFGTWRDHDGRLVWGANDFDEAWQFPYTLDLVRLATSALLAIQAAHLCLPAKEACANIAGGYRDAMKIGGCPFVLAERHAWLRAIAQEQLREPQRFWAKLCGFRSISRQKVPKDAWGAMQELIPDKNAVWRIVLRQAGLGARGHQRYVALLNWNSGFMAREAKALAPSAAAWLGQIPSPEMFYARILERAMRVPDPLFRVKGNWLVRRLAPDCSRVELASLPKRRDEERLLYCMGWETANIHLGSRAAIARVKSHLAKQPAGWLFRSAKVMRDAVVTDWKDWRRR
jgi:Uncharacterized protein conserved in bacteria (DUF2252)